MKIQKFNCKNILLIILAIVCIMLILSLSRTVVPMIYNPMRRTSPMIRNYILRHTPIGMWIDEVMEVIECHQTWGVPSVNRNSGFIIQGSGVPSLPLFSVVGYKSIQTRPERYSVPLFHERGIRIFWGFDDDGKLIEVFVNSIFQPRLV